MICIYCKKDFEHVTAHRPRCKEYQKQMKINESKINKNLFIDLYFNKEYSKSELINYFDVNPRIIKNKFNEYQLEERKNRYTNRRNTKMRLKKQNYTEEENKQINKKREKTCLKKYGEKNVSKSKKVLDKILESKLNNIDSNGLNSMQRGVLKNKDTCLKKYGVDNVRKAPEIIAKIMKTKFQNGSKSYYVSPISQEFFWYLFANISDKLRNHTYFSELNNEYGIYKNGKYYYYDFVISSIKLCIEFNGDYWHCNPISYSENYIHPQSGIRAENIWDFDAYKIKLIKEERDYTCFTIWESEYNSNKISCVSKILDYINLSEKLV